MPAQRTRRRITSADVGDAVAPGVVHRLARLQWQGAHALSAGETGLVLAGQVLLKELEVLAVVGGTVMVVANHAVGLQTVDEGILLVESPVESLFLVVPHAVEPDGTDGAVVREQFRQLAVHEGIVGRPVGGALVVGHILAAAGGIVGAIPVHVGIVEVQLESLLGTGGREFLQHVASEGRGLDDIVVAGFAVPHGESVVVAAGEGDVLCACLLEEQYPLAGAEP